MVHQTLASGNRKYKSPGMVAHHLMHNYLLWLHGYIHSLLQTYSAPSWTDVHSLHLLLTSAKTILFCAMAGLCRRIFWVPHSAFCSLSLVSISLYDPLFWMWNFQKVYLAIDSSPYKILYISEELLFCFFSFLSSCILTDFVYSLSTKPQIRKSFKNER